MTAAEVWFLRAEAALRGISTEDPKICYETGVKTSFEQWGVGGVDAYLQSDKTPADYKDPFDTQFDMKHGQSNVVPVIRNYLKSK